MANRTAFLAERVLGSVVASGVKVMVLGVIVGIGSGFLPELAGLLGGGEIDLAGAMSLALASLALLGLGIFGPGIASGLVAGAPQLGAGAAAGTAAAATGTMIVGGGAALGLARAGGSAALGALRAGTAMGSAAASGYRLGQETAGTRSVAAGFGGVAATARGASAGALRRSGDRLGLGASVQAGRETAWRAGAKGEVAAVAQASDAPTAPVPAWANDLRASQRRRAAGQAALQALGEGSRGGSGANPDIAEKED